MMHLFFVVYLGLVPIGSTQIPDRPGNQNECIEEVRVAQLDLSHTIATRRAYNDGHILTPEELETAQKIRYRCEYHRMRPEQRYVQRHY